MRDFDYYCFVECENEILLNKDYKKIVKSAQKVSNILDLDIKNKRIAKIIRQCLILYKRNELKHNNFAYLEDLVDYCKQLSVYVEKISNYIKYHDGLYNVNGYTFLGMYEREIDEAIMRNKFLVYHPKIDVFTDICNCEIDIQGKNIFPRTNNPKLRDKIYQMNAIGINTRLEEEMLYNWFLYVKVEREIKETTLRDIYNEPEILKDYIVDNKIFMKTVEKKLSDLFEVRKEFNSPNNLSLIQLDKIDNPYARLEDINLDEKILISKPVKTTQDQFGLREWRIFVIDNEVQSISRRDAKKSIVVEHEVKELANKKTKLNTGILPCNYVMDIMEYIDENGILKLDVVEYNPVMNAWSFFDNNIVYGSIKIINNLSEIREMIKMLSLVELEYLNANKKNK